MTTDSRDTHTHAQTSAQQAGTITPVRPATAEETAGQPVMLTPSEVVLVKVWQIPVRVLHWTLVASIVVLTVTGLYIGTPALALSGRVHLSMAYARGIHLFTGYVFIAVLIGRVIFMFTGNRWARWDQFLPVHRERWKLLLPSLRYYLFLDKEPPPVVGHNPLAGLTYLVLFGMFALLAVTGLALDGLDERDGFLWFASGWIYNFIGVGMVRFIHHLIMWLTIGFVVHHVYSAVLVDHEEASGEVSSIVSGWKTLPKDRVPEEWQ